MKDNKDENQMPQTSPNSSGASRTYRDTSDLEALSSRLQGLRPGQWPIEWVQDLLKGLEEKVQHVWARNKEIVKWAKSQGFDSVSDVPHVRQHREYLENMILLVRLYHLQSQGEKILKLRVQQKALLQEFGPSCDGDLA